MSGTRRFLVASAGVLLLALTLVLSNAPRVIGQSSKPAPGIAAPLAADFVTLESHFGEPGACEVGVSTERILPDGTKAPFVVPRGKVLVVTDVAGTVSSTFAVVWTTSHLGQVASLSVRFEGSAGTQSIRARAAVNSAAISGGTIPVELHLQSGVVSSPGSIVCVGASVGTLLGGITATGDARVQGYLMNQ